MTITENHFGQHLILNKDMTDIGGAFDRFIDLIPATSFRYPGGGVTEHLSPDDGSWDAIFGDPLPVGDNGRVVTVKEAFSFADEHDAAINFVLPTANFFEDGQFGERMPDTEAIDDMMARVTEMISGKYGSVEITTFEIGNEYWGGQDMMTPTEYGRLADVMAKSLQQTFDEYRIKIGPDAGWTEPKIAVQSGAWWKSNIDEGSLILEQLSAEAREAIDAVVGHHYPKTHAQAENHNMFYKEIDKFIDAEGFEDLEIHISEWNMSSETDETGMQQIPGMLSAFDQMLDRGVDHANVWGTQYKFLASRLSGMSDNHADGVDPEDVEIWLTPAGEMYRILQDKTIGTNLLDLKIDDISDEEMSEQTSLHAYGNEDKKVFFISSMSDTTTTIDLDLDALMEGFAGGHLSATLMSAKDIPGTVKDEGDPTSKHARAELDHLDQDEIFAGGGIINLDPHSTLVVTVTKPGIGVHLSGQDSVLDPLSDLGEVMTGGKGNDTIKGNLGDDTIFGGSGNDLIFGGAGEDSLFGGEGSDVIIASEGKDAVFGGEGHDAIVSKGNSAIETGDDGSIVVIAEGSSEITSGGADYFAINGTESVAINGFHTDEDYLHFGKSGDMNVLAAENMSVSGGDLVISAEGLGKIVLHNAADQYDALHKKLSAGVDREIQVDTLAKYMEDMSGAQAKALAAAAKSAEGKSLLFDNLSKEDLAKFTPDVADALIGKQAFEPLPPKPELPTEPILPPVDGQVPEVPTPAPSPVPNPPEEIPGEDSDPGSGGKPDEPGETPPGPSPVPEPPPVDEEEDDDNDGDDWEAEPDYPPVDEYPEDPEEEAESSGGGGCAMVAAFDGNGLHPEIFRLREFRDNVLITTSIGRAFITAYWVIGPMLYGHINATRTLGWCLRLLAALFLKFSTPRLSINRALTLYQP